MRGSLYGWVATCMDGWQLVYMDGYMERFENLN